MLRRTLFGGPMPVATLNEPILTVLTPNGVLSVKGIQSLIAW